jgi:DNA polymerase V
MTRMHPPSPIQIAPASAGHARLLIPLVGGSAAAGFPSPAADYLDRPLDFNELLVENPDATFAVRVTGDSMTGAGIFPGDIAIVDRSRIATDRNVIVAILDGEFTIKRYRHRGQRRWLQAENPDYKNIELGEQSAFEIWGVVRKSIRML